jgi:hypothetical protein
LRLVSPIYIEYLDSVVFPIRDVDPSVIVGNNVVGNIKLASSGARLTPRLDVFSIWTVFVYTRIAVAI